MDIWGINLKEAKRRLVTVIGFKAQDQAPLIDEQGRILLESTGITIQNKLLKLVEYKTEEEKYISVGVDDLTENLGFGYQADDFNNANSYSHFFLGRMHELFLLGGSLDNLTPYFDNTLGIGLKNVKKMKNLEQMEYGMKTLGTIKKSGHLQAIMRHMPKDFYWKK